MDIFLDVSAWVGIVIAAFVAGFSFGVGFMGARLEKQTQDILDFNRSYQMFMKHEDKD